MPVTRASLRTSFVLALAALPIGCAVQPPSTEPDATEPTLGSNDAIFTGTVAQAVAGTCSTASVKPLSQQIIDEMSCITPNTLAKLPARPNLVLGTAVFPYLVPSARDELVKALDEHPGTTMTVNSMFRTVAQQYLLYGWYKSGHCGIPLAAHPGLSNHETGLAIDVSETSTWRSDLDAHGFSWFGSSDPVHYDFNAQSAKGLDVQAFQRLWNANHPSDKIAEDGSYGPQTEARLKASPAAGFPIGSTCGAPQSPPPQSPPPQSPPPSPTPQPQGGPWSCTGSTGKTPLASGDYYATNFGCWVDASGATHTDPGDNCVPQCLSKLQASGDCAGLSGPACEEHVNWYAADADRFGCGTRLEITNTSTGKRAVVEVIDGGPACWVEQQAGTGIVDLSSRATEYLFGGSVGWSDKAGIHVVVVDPSTPLGPE